MKGTFRGISALAILIALFTSAGSAQTAIKFGIGAGVTLPLGDFGDATKTGFQGLAHAEFRPENLPVGFRVEGMYQRLGFSDLFETAFGTGNVQVISGTANVVYTFQTSAESKLHPYVIGGAGAYNMKFNFDDSDDDSETKFGVNAGAGFDMAVGSASVFVEGRFHNVFTEGDSSNFVPISVGVRFGGGGGSM